jgi:hypothetical protein
MERLENYYNPIVLSHINRWGIYFLFDLLGGYSEYVDQHMRKNMKINNITIMVFLLAITVSSCTAFTPAATETPSPSETSLPTSTITAEATIPSTETQIPITETPISIALPLPSGTPLTHWEGFPIMPNAIAGNDNNESYLFSITASTEEIQLFYEKELAILGWALLGVGTGNTDAVFLFFSKDASPASISILPQDQGVTLVLLVN